MSAPTLLDYGGINAPPSVYGRSLRPALEGQRIESRPVVSSLTLYTYPGLEDLEVNIYEALRTPEMKLFRRTLLVPNAPPQLTHVGFCDLTRDPREQSWTVDVPQVLARNPDAVRAMMLHIHANPMRYPQIDVARRILPQLDRLTNDQIRATARTVLGR